MLNLWSWRTQMANQEIEIKLAQTRQGIGVEVKSGGGISEVLHDETLKGKGTFTDRLGIADDVMADIASKATETALQEETDARIQADEQLQANIDTVAGNLETETTARINADSDLSDKIDTVENDLTGDIDSLTTTVENNYTTLDTRITEVAESLQETIEDNVVALQQEDTELQNQINAHSQTLTDYDTRIINNANAITQEISDRQTADDELQDQIDNLAARGRFLALWNATTGLPESNPGESPYVYKTGDYYIVGTVGETNYKPSGTQFVVGQPSTEIETEELTTDDVYYYDGAVWRLQVNHGKTVSFANLAGQPEDNTALKQALDSKQDVITDLDSYVKNTDYANTSVGGVIRPYSDYGTYVNSSNGYLQGVTRTQAAYLTAPHQFIISKGTLENVKENLVASVGDTKYQSTLVSGTNIKTLNNESLLGSGNIDIKSAQWGNITGNITAQADLQEALDDKTTVIIRSW